MATTAASSPGLVGRRILGEIEETSLEDVLQRIRAETTAPAQQQAVGIAAGAGPGTQHTRAYLGRPVTAGNATDGSPVKGSTTAPLRLPSFPIPALQQLVARHFRSTRGPELVAGGQRPLALVYLLVATLIAAPLRQSVVVVDAEARFDARQLLGVQPKASPVDSVDIDGDEAHALALRVTEDDLQHVHMFRVDPRWHVPLSELVAAAEQRVLYGAQRRRDRPWWGTIVVGGAGGSNTETGSSSGRGSAGGSTLGHGTRAALTTGANGWLRVDREELDALEAQHERQRQLLALFEDVHLNQDNDDSQDTNVQEPETKSLIRNSYEFKPVTWIASSPWGSFAFQLHKLSM